MDSRTAEVIAVVVGQIIIAVTYIVSTRMWVTFLTKRVDAHDQSHRDHYSHAADRTIHQESMDSKLIAAEFHNVKNQINQHVAEDLRVFDEIKTELRSIRSAVQDVREHMPRREAQQ